MRPLLPTALSAIEPAIPLNTTAVIPPSLTSPPTPRPTPKETDICLQRKFLAVSFCNDINPEWNNNTLKAAGFRCCWDMPMPVEGNPKLS